MGITRKLGWLLVLGLLGCGGRSGVGAVGDLPDGATQVDGAFDAAPDVAAPLSVECGEEARFTEPGRPIALEVRLTGGMAPLHTEWRMVAQPEASSVSIKPTSGTVTGINPDVVGLYQIAFDVEDAEGARASCAYDVTATRQPPTVQCPDAPVVGAVGMPIPLRGAGDRVFVWRWSVEGGPAGAHATVDPDDARSTVFRSDRDGPHTVRVTGYGADGASASCELTVLVTGGPEVTCPAEEIVTPSRQPVTLTAQAADDEGVARVRWEVTQRPAGSSAQPASPTARSTVFTPDKKGEYVLRFTATDTDGLEASCEVHVRATPTPPTAICPDAVITTPLEVVELTGRGVDDGTLVSYAWAVTRRPAGSAAQPPAPPDEATTSFRPDVAGDYVLELTVTDDDGQSGQCTVPVQAQAREGLRVEIYWNGPPDRSCDTHPGPGCDPTDVDVHLLRPGNETWLDDNGDCYWFNCNAMRGRFLSWGAPGTADDPHLDLDDVEGFGPENINVDEPAPGTYRVGVDFWEGETMSTAQVVVNIYCGAGTSAPVATFGPVTLRDREPGTRSQDNNDFWRVADVTIREGASCVVTDLSNPDGSPNIILHRTALRTR